ncbi:type II secretion system inner membrane protein GspF [Oceaniglobus trochenteri]|uniref:type II secretion system inner membrane protein GspF n=1 Tax=Oceaniglobus trochenteri TaxID=2763260 RepID=UPI001CFFC4BA|nr:type II secretion system inner membrane protein GspF [Oceaniglobus trochenteri]
MAGFAWRAADAQGRSRKGVIDAPSAAAARQSLRAQGLLPISVEPTRAKATPGVAAKPLRGGISGRALALLTRQLATLLGGGVRIEDALQTVARQGATPKVEALLLNLRAGVVEGRSLGQTLEDYPGTFGDYYRATVQAGETSGRLGEVMEHLADHVENRAKNRNTVQLALLYPALLALVSLGVIVALLTFVVPDIVRVFTGRGADLPGLTRALIAVSGAVQSWGLVALGGVVALGVALRLALARPGARLAWHRRLTRVPGLRGLILKMNAAQFAGTLATLTISGVPLTDALAAAGDTVGNLHIRARIAGATTRVREGQALSRALQDAAVFPPMMIAMVASGEASGRLGPSLARAATDQRREIDSLVAAIVALVEPLVLLVMGGIVMLLVLAILLPIVNLNNLVG